MNDNYDDIINLPHYEPQHHTRMPMSARAAQFAPFAALTGHDEAIHQTEQADTARKIEADSPIRDGAGIPHTNSTD